MERTGDVNAIHRNGFLCRHVHTERDLGGAHAGATCIETRSSQCRRVSNHNHVFTGQFQHAVSEVVRAIFTSKGFIGVGPAVAIDILEDQHAIFKGIGVKDAHVSQTPSPLASDIGGSTGSQPGSFLPRAHRLEILRSQRSYQHAEQSSSRMRRSFRSTRGRSFRGVITNGQEAIVVACHFYLTRWGTSSTKSHDMPFMNLNSYVLSAGKSTVTS